MDYLKLDFDTLKMMNVMHSQALDPHVNRKRFREGLWA